MHSIKIIWACLILISMTLLAAAQTSNTGALSGTVTDSNGGAIPGATITISNEETGENRTVTSQESGNYTIPLLQPGNYRVEVSFNNFKKAVKAELKINVTQTERFDVQLEPGGIQEQVIVSSKEEVLQTESSTLGRVTTRQQVVNLPLSTRNYTQIVTLSPGINAEVSNAAELGRGASGESQGNFRVHGSSGRDNNFQMNGIPVNDLQASGNQSGGVPIPNPDTIEEFKVQTGLFDAAFGRTAGANVNVVTRSGTNNFHGTLFEFFRNDKLNANDFFRNKVGRPRGVLKQNQFGGTLGGRIIKDKLLFFGSYQGTIQRNGVSSGSVSNIFTPALTNDRSRSALGMLFAGQSGQFGGVAVLPDGSNISPQALAILNQKLPNGQYVIPTPQTVDPTQPFARRGFSAFSEAAKFDENQFMVNLDFLHTERSRFAGRFFYADSDTIQPFPAPNLGGSPSPGYPLIINNKFRNFSLSHTYVFNSNFFNQIDFGVNRISVPITQSQVFKFSDVGVNAPSNANSFPQIAISGSLTTGGNGQSSQFDQTHYTIQDSMSYVRGAHTFRFGGGITRSAVDVVRFQYIGGVQFLSYADFLLGLPGGPTSAGGNGTPFSNVFLSADIPGLFERKWRIVDGNAYIQDDYKVTSRLTLNLGFRYERLGHLADRLGRNSSFDVTRADPNPPAGGTFAGYVVSQNLQTPIPAGVTQLKNSFGIAGKGQNNFAPRLGFAYRLPRTFLPFTDRMVLRGGYGVYYTRATGQPFFQLLTNPPFGSFRFISGAANAQASIANPFGPEIQLPQFIPYSPTTRQSGTVIGQNYRPPHTQQYSLNVQADLGLDLLLEVGYVGTKGSDQIVGRSVNQAMLASSQNPIRGVTTNTVANIAQRVPILGFTSSGLTLVDSVGKSRYDGLEVSLTKRFSQGLQFLASYTFSRAFSDFAANTFAGGGVVPGNQVNSQANYGRSTFNREHRLVVSYYYQLPEFKFGNSFLKTVFNGWAASGVTTIQSGLPLSLTGTNGSNAYGITNDRAQLAPGCTYADLITSGSVRDRLNGYFNRDCILRNAAGTAIWLPIEAGSTATNFGNSGVGIVSGPGQNNTDLAIIKRTRFPLFGESSNIEFRTEFFNLFNTPQFAAPVTSVTSATFGVISATSVNPRIIQFGIKLNF